MADAQEDHGSALSDREGWTLRQRFTAPDSYGLLLLMILVGLVCSAATGRSAWGNLATVVIQAVILLYALYTSRASARLVRAGVVFVVVSVVVAVIGALQGNGSDAGVGLVTASSAVLALGAVLAIARRVAAHPTISGSTVLAAISIYLTIGMFFGAVYGFLASVGSKPFFAQPVEPSAVDFLYFSFVTQTTVGYGDLTAAGNLGRMLAVTQALVGQVYLVTVVALTVANLGRQRRVVRRGEGGP